MLNRFYFLQKDLPGREPVKPDGITIAHLTDGSAESASAVLEHQYSMAGNYPFCLMLRDAHEPVAAVRRLLLFFFHPCYETTEKGRPLFLCGSPGAKVPIQKLLDAQSLGAEVILSGDAGDSVATLNANDPDPADDYYRYCLARYSPEDIFLLSGGEPGWWQRQLARAESRLAGAHDRFYRLASERLAAGRLAAKRDNEVRRLSEELQIMNQLLELSSKHDEVDHILRFYRNEYEILPLWYKRFGHVIKVIQGKRSLRSLFDKSVKKYKD